MFSHKRMHFKQEWAGARGVLGHADSHPTGREPRGLA